MSAHPHSAPTATSAPIPRNLAVDTYRGLVMFLMAAEVLRLAQIARAFPANPVWQFLAFNQSHVPWVGMSLHDTIQPAFTLLVGIALPYSLRSRQRRGQSFRRMFAHTLLRSFILIALGILLRTLPGTTPNFTFEDTLTQIGLGYTFAFLLAFARPRTQWIAFVSILFVYWLAWALYPAPAPALITPPSAFPPNGTPISSPALPPTGTRTPTLGQAFDLWFLNLFPRPHRFLFNAGGYLTLSFIPTLGTQIIGLIAGRWLLNAAPAVPIRRLSITAALLMASGLALHFTGICPIVKRIWTPSWTLFSGGVCLLFLVAIAWLVDLRGHRRQRNQSRFTSKQTPSSQRDQQGALTLHKTQKGHNYSGSALAFPFIVLGTNSLAAYLLSWIADQLDGDIYTFHLWPSALNLFSPAPWSLAIAPLYVGGLTLLLYWLILFAMYKNKIFLRI
jgi:heparan-alpha-glucosaminide N-acetyltransferase